MKVGIVTWYKNGNFGGTLQAFSLSKVFASFGVEVEFVNYRPDGGLKRKIKNAMIYCFCPCVMESRWKIWNFVKMNLRETPQLNDYEALSDYARKNFDFVVCGSDQIWASFKDKLLPEVNYLTFIPSCFRVAYAPSIGLNEIPERHKSLFTKFVSDFTFLSVREKKGAELIRALTGLECRVVIDPSLLLTSSDWNKLLPEKRFMNKPYIFCYFLRRNDVYVSFVKKMSRHLNCQVIAYQIKREGELRLPMKSGGPLNFVHAIRDAEYVMTDSFHGCAYALLFKKALGLFKRFSDDESFCQNSRLYNILEKLGINDIWIDNDDIQTFMVKQINYDEVMDKLSALRSDSLDYIKSFISFYRNK